MREENIAKLVAAGYDGDELSGMDDRELQNEVAKIEGTAPTNAISQGGTTPDSQYLNEQKKAEEEKKKAEYEKKVAEANERFLGAQRNIKNAMLGIDGKSLGTQPEVAELVSQRDAATVNNDKDAYTEADNGLKDLENPEPDPPEPDPPKPEPPKPEPPKPEPEGGSLADYVTAKNKDGGSGIRDYLIADALATFARNTGKDIGNVAAAYSGGTMNNDRETSLLEKRNAQKAQAETEEQIGKEYADSRLGQELKAHGLDNESKVLDNESKGLDNESKGLANEQTEHSLEASRRMSTLKREALEKADKFRKKGDNEAAAIMDGVAGEYALLESGAASSVDDEEHIGNIVAALAQAFAEGVISKDEMDKQVKRLHGSVKELRKQQIKEELLKEQQAKEQQATQSPKS